MFAVRKRSLLSINSVLWSDRLMHDRELENFGISQLFDRRAARYVRMSTDLQRYSIENQADAIRDFAARRGLNVVREYADEGRSGLRIGGREALQALISDVQNGRADYRYILVYDVSRWGRFQDADESAYYEYICKDAGVQVLYCAEQFENDGSISSTILKSVKRAMAGEYSRELSAKVFVGQCRTLKMGFWRGGTPGYGLRRQLVDENRNPRAVLEFGQRKSLQTDRVVLVPGPPAEVRTIKRIFKSFVINRKNRGEIAAELNARGLRTERGNLWSMQTIDGILKNERYVGHNVFNRISNKLRKKLVANPPDMWVRCDGAFKPIVAQNLFAKAQVLIEQRHELSDQELLNSLAALWQRKGHLSAAIIASAKRVPHPTTYVRRFGSLPAAYERIGFVPGPQCYSMVKKATTDALLASAVGEIVLNVEQRGGTATYFDAINLLTINEKLKVSVCLACARNDGPARQNTITGKKWSVRWQIRKLKYEKTDLVLVIRLDSANAKIKDYYWFPTVHLSLSSDKHRRLTERTFPEKYRHDELEAFYQEYGPAHPRTSPGALSTAASGKALTGSGASARICRPKPA